MAFYLPVYKINKILELEGSLEIIQFLLDGKGDSKRFKGGGEEGLWNDMRWLTSLKEKLRSRAPQPAKSR